MALKLVRLLPLVRVVVVVGVLCAGLTAFVTYRSVRVGDWWPALVAGVGCIAIVLSTVQAVIDIERLNMWHARMRLLRADIPDQEDDE